MATSAPLETLADLLDRLGHVPPERVRLLPAPGTATVADVVDIERRENRLCELVDGVLVEKAMGYIESMLAAALVAALRTFVLSRNLGLVTGADGMVQLFAGLVRIPDVAYVSWSRVPGGRVPREPVPLLAPDLAIEVLSAGNTDAEMDRKLAEYFGAGVRVVWLVDPRSRTIRVYSGTDAFETLGEERSLDGGQVLPGFALAVREIFAEIDRHAES
jgi:Uma2 family endonuclease